MGLTPQLSNIHHHLFQLGALLRRLVSQPPSYVRGLFGSECRVEARTWHIVLLDDANSCKLVRLEFCKAKGEKLHEFLVFYFSHPTHTTARAVVVVHRDAKERSESPVIMSEPDAPSDTPIEVFDRVHVMGRGGSLEAYLSETYGQYDKLCAVEYAPAESSSFAVLPPSAIQLSILLLLVSNHRPNYPLCEHNRFWYADTVFEACKALFPGYREECNKCDDRARHRSRFPVLATHTLPDICNEYKLEWPKAMQRRRANTEMATQQEWERRFEEERRHHEAIQRELERKLQESQKLQQEMCRRIEEAERRCEQLQTAGQASPHVQVM